MIVRRLVVGAALAVVLVLVTAGPAAAHATLEATSPADGAHLDQAPNSVSLTFSEDVSAPLGAVRVFDAQGHRVDNGDVVARDNTVTVGMNQVGDGGYIVTWRVISADSHPVNGAFTFTVGDGTAASSGVVSSLLNSGSDKKWEQRGQHRPRHRLRRDVHRRRRRHLPRGRARRSSGPPLVGEGRAVGRDRRCDRRPRAVADLGRARDRTRARVDHPRRRARPTCSRTASARRPSSCCSVSRSRPPRCSGRRARRRRASRPSSADAPRAIGFAFAGHTTITTPRWLVYTSDVVHVLAGVRVVRRPRVPVPVPAAPTSGSRRRGPCRRRSRSVLATGWRSRSSRSASRAASLRTRRSARSARSRRRPTARSSSSSSASSRSSPPSPRTTATGSCPRSDARKRAVATPGRTSCRRSASR